MNSSVRLHITSRIITYSELSRKLMTCVGQHHVCRYMMTCIGFCIVLYFTDVLCVWNIFAYLSIFTLICFILLRISYSHLHLLPYSFTWLFENRPSYSTIHSIPLHLYLFVHLFINIFIYVLCDMKCRLEWTNSTHVKGPLIFLNVASFWDIVPCILVFLSVS
jgi:hypothetical protein